MAASFDRARQNGAVQNDHAISKVSTKVIAQAMVRGLVVRYEARGSAVGSLHVAGSMFDVRTKIRVSSADDECCTCCSHVCLEKLLLLCTRYMYM